MSISYIVHSAILLAGIYILYRVLLYKETFFKLNRGLLLFGILISFSLPLVPTPSKVHVAGVSIESKTPTQLSFRELVIANPDPALEVREPLQKNEVEAAPMQLSEKPTKAMGKEDLIFYIYLSGVLIFLLNFLFQVCSLLLTIRKHRVKGSRIIELPKLESPCSFFGYTFISADISDEEQRRQILLHEQVHNDQYHSIDILLGELLCIVQWFNPFSWITRKAIERNLEFLVDQKLIDRAVPKKSYQYNLLSLSTSDTPLAITTKFNYSLLKSRISMMNSKRSSISHSWKYLLFVPSLVFSVFLLNPEWGRSESMYSDATSTSDPESMQYAIIIPGNSTKENLRRIQLEVKEMGHELTFEDVQWDDQEILLGLSVYLIGPHSFSVQRTFNDLNRFESIVFSYLPKLAGSRASGSFEDQVLPEIAEVEGFDKANFRIMDASLNETMVLPKYMDGVINKKSKSTFDREKNWAVQFFNDDKIEDADDLYFEYSVNDKKVSREEFNEGLRDQEVLSLNILEYPDTKAVVSIKTRSKHGFYSDASSMKIIEGSRDKLLKVKRDRRSMAFQQNAFQNNGNTNITVFEMDGIITDYTFDTVPVEIVKRVKVDYGTFYGDNGEKLRNEFRVNFITIE